LLIYNRSQTRKEGKKKNKKKRSDLGQDKGWRSLISNSKHSFSKRSRVEKEESVAANSDRKIGGAVQSRERELSQFPRLTDLVEQKGRRKLQ